MRLVTGADGPVLAWLAEHHDAHFPHEPKVVLGIADGDVLKGAFVVVWHCDTTAELSGYGNVSHETVKHMFRAVFGAGVYRLELRTQRKNKTIRKAAEKFGFKLEGVAKHYYGPNDDAFVYAMIRDNCRWLRHGQRFQDA